MLILIDLDGTLINTVHPSWKPYKDGQDKYSIEPYLAQIPVFAGAREFIALRKSKGDKIVVVSDSHFLYVSPICKMFGVDFVSLADKPNSSHLNSFFKFHPEYKTEFDSGNCVVIGDTKLDIELGRHIGAMTIWFLPYKITDDIKDERDGIGDEIVSKKMGPTFAAKTFQEIDKILDSHISNLYSIEAAFAESLSSRAVKLNNTRYADGSYACIRCLARQEQGACDKYARADKYYLMSNAQRTQDFLQTLAAGISNYLNQPSLSQGWDFFTYLTDKKTTIPPNKMKEIFDMVATNVPKVQLLKWSEKVSGSLREQNLYSDRQSFLQKYLFVECPMETTIDMYRQEQKTPMSLSGKSVIVLDDQLTTGATAWHVIRKLKEKGVRNVLFIAMFQMILPVSNDVKCPRCGKSMLIKIRRSDGHKFYSCVPPDYRGEGCGYILDVEGNPIDRKFVEIQQNYEWGYDKFKIGRSALPNFKQIVVDSEANIQLIDRMRMYNTGASDDDIKYMREIIGKAEKLVFNDTKRNTHWEDFIYNWSHCDYWDSYGYSLEYVINSLDELDNYIKYSEIEEKYPKSVEIYYKGRNRVPKIKLIIGSEDIIKLIDRHELYVSCEVNGISDEYIRYVQLIDKKGQRDIYSNVKRNKYYKEFACRYSNENNHEFVCLEYSLEHINELDYYIASIE